MLDHNDAQCVVDADCERFDGHPVCEAGLCVASGLGPTGCFFGEPKTQDQFANHCTTAKTEQFDNCARLGLCDDSGTAGAWSATVQPPPPDPPPAPIGNPPVVTEDCVNAAGGTASVIYVTGSTNLPPLLKAVQPLLYDNTTTSSPPFVVVFAPQTSCKGAASIYDSVKIFHNPDNPAFYYDRSGKQTFCKLAVAGNVVDVGESDVYPSSCQYSSSSRVGDYPGPILAITFVVPSNSPENAISAEAAHMVFGSAGGGAKNIPWLDPSLYFVRSSGTGTVQLLSRAINLSPSRWWGIDRSSAANLVDSMEAIDPMLTNQAIGILSSDFADHSRNNLKILAFQRDGQRYAYYPDSTPISTDKANVRDGHYRIWGAIHLLAALDRGVPSLTASALITRFTVSKLDQNLVAAIIDSGFVPNCAMKVTHTSELGDFTAFTPNFGCGCFFDMKTSGTTKCHVCSKASDCTTAAPACNYGFCEVQ